jgi:hypothetical protein
MTHDQIREMVRRVNPIPDPNMLETVDAPVLTTERRTDMQTDSREITSESGQSRWRGPLVGIAAAVAVLVAGGIFLLTNDDPPVATPAPNATLLTPELEFEPLDPGAYYVDMDGDPATAPRGTFVIEGSGWAGIAPGVVAPGGELTALLMAQVDEVGSPACGRSPELQPAGTSAEALASQFAAAGFTVQEAASPVSAFGQSGYHLVVKVPAGCADGSHMVWEGPTFGRYYQAAGQVIEYWFFDVEGTQVMVEAASFPESRPEDVTELRAVIDTLVITP